MCRRFENVFDYSCPGFDNVLVGSGPGAFGD